MRFNYKITSELLNTLTEFYRIHGALYMMGRQLPWHRELRDLASRRTGIAAVGLDSIVDLEVLKLDSRKPRVPAELKQDFNNYRHIKDHLGQYFGTIKNLGLETFNRVHQSIIGEEYTTNSDVYRRDSKTVLKVLFENGTYKRVENQVRTRPSEIKQLLDELNTWIMQNYRTLNPAIMGALVYFALAKIHPYQDGNGRTAKAFIHGILFQNGIDVENYSLIEEYYLKNRTRYYDLISEAIDTGDQTAWLEFYANSLLYGALEAARVLHKLSGGSIDILSNKFIELTPSEKNLVDAMQGKARTSGAELARELEISRQYVNNILHNLMNKGLVVMSGERRSATYNLKVQFSE
jgi:Fic family protein